MTEEEDSEERRLLSSLDSQDRTGKDRIKTDRQTLY